jgi:hypothetical protein
LDAVQVGLDIAEKGRILIEIKAMCGMMQRVTCLRLSRFQPGLLKNFHALRPDD